MPQITRFGKRLSSFVSVAALGTRSRQKLSAFILLILAVGGLPTAAHALKVQFIVNGVTVHETTDLATPSATAQICSLAPCTGTKGFVVTQNITTTTAVVYKNPTTLVNVLQVEAGAKATAKVETNGTTIGGTTGASNSIINTLNVGGTFTLLVPGKLEIVVTSDFALRPPVAGSTTELGTWRTLNRGGSKCALDAAGKYQASFCSITGGSLDNGSCTICRSYGYTDDGYVLRKDSNGLYNFPAGNVVVGMASTVTFKDTAGAAAPAVSVAPPGLSKTIPNTQTKEDGHFYFGSTPTTVQMNAPCEPTRTTCAPSETKTTKLTFDLMQANYRVVLPLTSTDVSAAEPGVLTAHLQTHIPIDVQPIDPVPDPNNPGFFIGGVNNDWDPKSNGNRQVLALSTPTFDACTIQPFDGPTPLVFISVAGSELTPLQGFSQYAPNGSCIGLIFNFNMAEVNATIDPDSGTTEEKRQTCLDTPTATLLVMNADLTATYQVQGTQGGGKKISYQPGPECTIEGDTAKCTVTGEVGGSQLVQCSTPAG